MTATGSATEPTSSAPVLDWAHGVTEIPVGGRHVQRTATDAERTAIAASLEVPECHLFEASYAVEAMAGGRYRLKGTLSAEVVQLCVVTLEPIRQDIRDDVDVTFCPAESMPEAGEGEREILSEPDTEIIQDGRIAVGHVLFEVLAAAIDPYPRAEGAEFDWRDPAADAVTEHGPFAALAKLKGQT
jgi:hypothetical protein